MVLNTNATLKAIASLLSTSGAAVVSIGDPKGPPDAQPAPRYPVSIRMVSAEIQELALDGGTVEQHVVMVTVYGAFIDTDGVVEIQMGDATNRMMSKMSADADLGGNIRHIDAAGIYGIRLGIEWGYKDVGGTEFRVAEISVPMVVDDNQTVTP